MKLQAYTISTLIDDLQALYHEHGDIPVLDGRYFDFHARHVELVTVDDWDNSTQTDEGEIPCVGHAVALGRRF